MTFARILGGILGAIALLPVAGCSSIPSGDTAALPAASVFAVTPPKPGYGVVYVGRPRSGNTSIFSVPLELDGKPLASVGFDKFIRVELPPGRHQIVAVNDTWSRAINGIPHPVDLTVEPGKVYYLLPKRWAANPGMTITMIGSMAIPEQKAEGHSSFSVQESPPTAAPPPQFLQLTPSAD